MGAQICWHPNSWMSTTKTSWITQKHHSKSRSCFYTCLLFSVPDFQYLYPLISVVYHSLPSWSLHTRKVLKSVRILFCFLHCYKFWTNFYWTKKTSYALNLLKNRLNFTVVSWNETIGELNNFRIFVNNICPDIFK